MYNRVEVRGGPRGWRGPMRALKDNRAAKDRVYDIWDGLPGSLEFGVGRRASCLFAWTQAGWAEMGKATLAVCQEVFGKDNVRVRKVHGNVVYSDVWQVAIQQEEAYDG